MAALHVLATGPLSTIQDLGRPGLASMGVGTSGAADRAALMLGNRLLGNDPGDAGIEVTAGCLRIRASGDVDVAITGAPCGAHVDGRGIGPNAPVRLRHGQGLTLGIPTTGLRTYLCVRGGIAVGEVLGSRSTDTLSGVGPPPLAPGDVLNVGNPPHQHPGVDLAAVPAPTSGEVTLRVTAGPRDDWFVAGAWDVLTGSRYVVSADSDRVGIRLEGATLTRLRLEELPSEGLVTGALQVPRSGLPTLMLTDHPVTGGYPVIGVVASSDVPKAAQMRPGQGVRFAVGP